MVAATRPAKSLGLIPRITTQASLLMAIAWVAFLRVMIAARTADHDAAVHAAQADLNKSLELTVSKQKVDAREYLQTLETEIAKHANENSAKLFVTGQTYTTPHGSIAAAKMPQRLEIDDEKNAVDRLVEQFDLQPEIDRLKEEFPAAFRFLRIKFEIDKQGLAAAYKAKEIGDEDLQARGFQMVEPKDKKITIKV